MAKSPMSPHGFAIKRAFKPTNQRNRQPTSKRQHRQTPQRLSDAAVGRAGDMRAAIGSADATYGYGD